MGCNYVSQPLWKVILGVPLIYLPIIATIPFVAIGVFLVKTHLTLVGGMEIQSYWDFVPSWVSHRYRNERSADHQHIAISSSPLPILLGI